MNTIVYSPDAISCDTPANIAIGPAELQATEVSTLRGPAPHFVPPAIDIGQVYYWSHVWQHGEQESRAELEAGIRTTFENAEDAIRWLLSSDD